MDDPNELNELAAEFKNCRRVLSAIGDETRQSIIMALLNGGCCPGIRVGEITKRTNLSRPAVSHHLKILKESNIINVNREGTMNYYYLDPVNSDLGLVKRLFDHIEHLMTGCAGQDKEGKI